MQIPTILGIGMLCATSTFATAAAKPSCEQIDAAISANEYFVEVALGNDPVAVSEALAAVRQTFAKIKPPLSDDATMQTEKRIKSMNEAVKAGDMGAASVAAVEVYKTLVVAFEQRLPTTLDAAMLDYAGFKLHGLAAATAIDWAAISATVAESNQNWESARKRMNDKAISDLLLDVHSGLNAASTSKNVAWLNSTAQILLDSVDLVERSIKNPSKDACE